MRTGPPHYQKLPLQAIDEAVLARPKVECTREEVEEVLRDLKEAVRTESYQPFKPTPENPLLSDDYIFDLKDEHTILLDLKPPNFVGKVLDKGKGAKRRLAKGYPQEFLFVFKYAVRLKRRDADASGVEADDIVIYIKVNDRKIPHRKVFLVSFHKNRPDDSY